MQIPTGCPIGQSSIFRYPSDTIAKLSHHRMNKRLTIRIERIDHIQSKSHPLYKFLSDFSFCLFLYMPLFLRELRSKRLWCKMTQCHVNLEIVDPEPNGGEIGLFRSADDALVVGQYSLRPAAERISRRMTDIFNLFHLICEN